MNESVKQGDSNNKDAVTLVRSLSTKGQCRCLLFGQINQSRITSLPFKKLMDFTIVLAAAGGIVAARHPGLHGPHKSLGQSLLKYVKRKSSNAAAFQ